MAIETVNLGTYANDGTGDDLRAAFRKVNNNFVALAPAILDGENLGTGIGIFNAVDPETNKIQFNTISGGDNISLSLVNNTLTISAVGGGIISSLEDDLNLNGHSINGTGTIDIEGSISTTGVVQAGDIQSTVWGIDVRNLLLLLQLVSGQDVDLGNFAVPTQGTLDLGGFLNPYNISYDFGTFLGTSGPTIIQQDFGTFDSPFQGGYDFGTLTSPLAGNIDAGAF